MRFKAKQKKVLLFIVAISIILFAFFNWQNNSIIISEMVFKNDTIPEAFKGYKILQISDLHNKEFGSKQNKILAKIEKINPDIIVVTGDLIDSNNTKKYTHAVITANAPACESLRISRRFSLSRQELKASEVSRSPSI